MKELCIDARMAMHSGIGTYIRNVVSRLKAGPFKIRLITHRKMVDQWPFLQQCDLIFTSASIYSIEEQVKLPFLVPRCDLFWSPHYNVPLAPVRARRRLTTIHDVCHLALPETLNFFQRQYAKHVIRRAIRLSDHILTVSQFSKDEIIKHTKAPAEKISVVLQGVDTTHFSVEPSPDLKREIQKKYQLPPNYFLFVSNLAPHKNIHRLLQAWSLLVKDFPDWKLILIGNRAKNHSWQILLEQNPALKDHLLFLGFVSDQELPALYQGAYGTVHPSLYEGFGFTPLEAMSADCPTVVSKAASLPEVCGDCAVYVDPYDVEDIAAGMRRLIEDAGLRHELKKKGMQHVRHFTWDKTAQKHLEVIERLLQS